MATSGKPLPEHLLAAFRRLIRDGMTKAEIARLTGVSRTTVIKHAKRLEKPRL